MLIILLVRGLTLPGSVNGIIYYITPQWDRLADGRVRSNLTQRDVKSLRVIFNLLIVVNCPNIITGMLYATVTYCYE